MSAWCAQNVQPPQWTTIELTVQSADGVQADLCMQVAHLPCDINGDGNVGQTDPPAFAAEFTGRKSPYLADANGDGNVGQTDPPNFSANFVGRGFPKAQGTSLPPKPNCP